MKPEEHMLLIAMFARQERLIQTLTDIISRDATIKDDTRILDSLRLAKERMTPEIRERVENLYRNLALTSGVVLPAIFDTQQ
jgi:hypothetical protein